MNNDELKEHVTDTNIWLRLVFMLLFAVVFAAMRVVLTVVIAVQFLWVLFTGGKNDKLLDFAARLATYVYQIYRYLSFNTEKRPFPFDDFPSPDPLMDESIETETAADADEAGDDAEPEAEKKPAKAEVSGKKADKPAADESVDAASESGIEAEQPAEAADNAGGEEKKK